MAPDRLRIAARRRRHPSLGHAASRKLTWLRFLWWPLVLRPSAANVGPGRLQHAGRILDQTGASIRAAIHDDHGQSAARNPLRSQGAPRRLALSERRAPGAQPRCGFEGGADAKHRPFIEGAAGCSDRYVGESERWNQGAGGDESYVLNCRLTACDRSRHNRTA
jgi:hypothetical protein